MFSLFGKKMIKCGFFLKTTGVNLSKKFKLHIKITSSSIELCTFIHTTSGTSLLVSAILISFQGHSSISLDKTRTETFTRIFTFFRTFFSDQIHPCGIDVFYNLYDNCMFYIM